MTPIEEFESFANSKRYKTLLLLPCPNLQFESFANSKRYKTPHATSTRTVSLRALLIQKDTKHNKLREVGSIV